MIAIIYATRADDVVNEEEKRFKVTSIHVGGLKMRTKRGKRNAWDSERQRLTAMQWLISYGLAKAGARKKGKHHVASKGQDLLWSISSRVMVDMWLKYMRNPYVKFTKCETSYYLYWFNYFFCNLFAVIIHTRSKD